jgi:hypothetical protein
MILVYEMILIETRMIIFLFKDLCKVLGKYNKYIQSLISQILLLRTNETYLNEVN